MTRSAHLSLVHDSAEDEVSAKLALLYGGTKNDASCCMKVLMMLHVCTHGCAKDEVGRHGTCMSACMIAEYERVVMPLHGTTRGEETTLYGSSGDGEMRR